MTESQSPPFDAEALLAHAGWLRALARRLVRDGTQAEDLVHETFLAALQHRPRPLGSLRPWLARVLRSRRAWRARGDAGRRAREQSTARDEALPGPAELAERAEMQRRLAEEVLRLDEPYRSLVILRYYEDLSPTEIAARQGRSAGSVRGQLSRASAILRERLDHRDAESGLDWRAAFLPLLGREVPGGWMTTSSTTILAMKPITALVALAVSVACVLLVVRPPWRTEAPSAVEASRGEVDLTIPSPGSDPPPNLRALEVAVDSTRGTVPGSSRKAAGGHLIRGVLRTEAEGGPLPHFLLELQRDEKAIERFATDAEGFFSSTQYHAGEGYRLELIDLENQSRVVMFGSPFRHEQPAGYVDLDPPSEEPLELTIGSRLTIPLLLHGPADVIDSITGVDLCRGARANVFRSVRPLFVRAQLRGDAHTPWLRFFPIHEGFSTEDTWSLYAMSPDGLWAAWAEIAAEERTHFEPVELIFEATTGIEVTVPWSGENAPDLLGAHLTYLTPDIPSRSLEAQPDRTGESVFAIAGIPPGMVCLQVHAEGAETAERRLELEPGQIHRERVELQFPSDLVELEVEVRSETGEYRGALGFGAPASETGPTFICSPRWEEEDGVWIARGTFGPMPPGRYGLYLVHGFEPVPLVDIPREIDVPGPPVQILCLDAGPRHTLGLRVVDAESHEPLGEFGYRLTLNGTSGYVSRTEGDLGYWEDVPVAADARWRASAPGYGAAEGDWSEALLEGGREVVEVRLVRER